MSEDVPIFNRCALLRYAKIFATGYYLRVDGIPASEILETVEFLSSENGDDSMPKEWLVEGTYEEVPEDTEIDDVGGEDSEDPDTVSATDVLDTINEHALILVEFFANVTIRMAKGCTDELSK